MMFGCATFMPTKSLETPAKQSMHEVFLYKLIQQILSFIIKINIVTP